MTASNCPRKSALLALAFLTAGFLTDVVTANDKHSYCGGGVQLANCPAGCDSISSTTCPNQPSANYTAVETLVYTFYPCSADMGFECPVPMLSKLACKKIGETGDEVNPCTNVACNTNIRTDFESSCE